MVEKLMPVRSGACQNATPAAVREREVHQTELRIATVNYLDYFHVLPSRGKKETLEEEAARLLTSELPEYSRYFMAETLANIYNGRYESALSSLKDVTRGASEYASVRARADLPPAPRQDTLVRTLRYIKGMSSLEYPIF
jgi:hypothetical protein